MAKTMASSSNAAESGSRHSRCSSWAPATKPKMAMHEPSANVQPKEDNAESSPTGVASSSALASASKPAQPPPPPSAPPSSANNVPQLKSDQRVDSTKSGPDPMKDPGNRIGGLTSDASRCCHLEEYMFPRYLSLDCKQMDDYCLGCIKDKPNMKNLGRMYIEALHLKDFLKSPETINAQNKAASKGSGKRGRRNSDTSSKKKGRSPRNDKSDEPVTENNRLAQAYFGGLEGKRTWLLANSHKVGKGGGVAGSFCQVLQSSTMNVMEIEEDSTFLKTSSKKSNKASSPSDGELDKLLSSEVKLASLRRSMRLHDHTIPYDPSEDVQPELTSLENLVKHLPGYTPPSADTVAVDSLAGGGRKVSTEEPMSVQSARIDAVTSSLGVGMQPMKIESADKYESDKKATSRSTLSNSGPASAAPERIVSSSSILQKGGPHSRVSSDIKDRDNHDKLGGIFGNSRHSPQSNFDRANSEGKEAALAANMLLGSFRRNRRNFWAQKLKNGKAPKCAWCPSGSTCSTKKKANSNFEFGAIKTGFSSGCRDIEATGDALIQCLECDLIGCSPTLLNGKGGNQHAMLHFLMSGHRFGVTCGPLGEIFCMGCGDIVYHEVFDQERERIFLEQNIPALSWKESPILRGVDPSSFIVTPENGVVWRGMMATYPSPVSAQLVQASRFAAKRFSIFRGDIGDNTLQLGAKSAELSTYQQLHFEERLIPTPVGIYNLGNTCYMSAILQCMIHCKPLQEQYLRNVAHPYQSCEVLRCGGNKAGCLNCEMDKTFLEYYGSVVGIDTIAALEEQLELSSCYATPAREKKQTNGSRGHPLVPSHLLVEAWKNRGMKQLVGHGQHDAHEFFNAFVDCLATQALEYHKDAHDMRQIIHEKQIEHTHPSKNPGSESDTDFNTKMFTGTLRSVLICHKCGCKRTQTELFSSVSLPLAKELKTKGKATVQSILDHVTRPETLPDPVHCPSCSSKTKTLKQRTFSTLPQVLCLHLKRFDVAANKKITDFVPFPADNLDMGKHLPHWRERGLLAKERKYVGDRAESPKVLYNLFATVNHKGTIHQGHYVAHVKSGKSWYLCNDAFITTAGDGDGEKEVLSSEGAYMLFYQKRGIQAS